MQRESKRSRFAPVHQRNGGGQRVRGRREVEPTASTSTVTTLSPAAFGTPCTKYALFGVPPSIREAHVRVPPVDVVVNDFRRGVIPAQAQRDDPGVVAPVLDH